MISSASIETANDNSPVNAQRKGDSVGFRATLREQEMERRLHKHELKHLKQSSRLMENVNASENAYYEETSPIVGLPLFCTFIATLFSAYCLYSAKSLYLCVIALSLMVWAALWTTFQSSKAIASTPHRQSSNRLTPDVSILTATLAGLAIWGLVSREWGIPFSLTDGIAGFAGLTALISMLLSSRFTLIISAIMGVIWLGFYTLVPTINIVSLWIYPVLVVIQLFIAGHNDSKLASFFALIGGYSWLFWILNARLSAGDITLIHIAAFSMMIGMAHYRLGKAAGDALWKSASLHVVFGWCIAIAGAIGLQHYWLGTTPETWQSVSAHPFSQLSWQVIGTLSIALIGVAGLIRMAHNQMSTTAVLFTLCIAVAAAALYDQRNMIEGLIRAELNMPARPLMGLLVGAAITASSVAMCINGARRKSMLMMLAGLAVIAAQLTLMLDPNIWTAENGLAFALCLGASLCFAALFAADTSAKYA